jgi:hypothetical protein
VGVGETGAAGVVAGDANGGNRHRRSRPRARHPV